MPEQGDELQFDRVVTGSTPAASPGKLAVICEGCETSIDTEYYNVNGKSVCDGCRRTVEAAAETPRGMVPFALAGVYGLGAGVAGAIVYYAVIAIAHLEVGIVAILIGYMVGWAVRKGARGRGGRRFQVLAVALTYASVALAYAPVVIKQAFDDDRGARTAPAASRERPGVEAPVDGSAPASRPTAGGFLLGLIFMSVFIAALPALVVVGSFPSGLISAFIIFIGMRQAWKMTGALQFEVRGPYRVGAAAGSTAA